MNTRVTFTIFAFIIGVLMVVIIISLAQGTKSALATSYTANSIIQGWQQVNVDGFGDANNREAMRLAVHDNFLFASTDNPVTGGEVWRSANGTDWNQVSFDGFGVISNTAVFIEESFNSFLYAGTTNNATGAEVWRCIICNGTDWSRVVRDGFGDANNRTVQRVMVFSNTLYALMDNEITGVEVWKSTTGNVNSWNQSNLDGFGNPENTGAWAAVVYNGMLYVATAISEDWTPPETFGVEVWRTNGNDNWAKVTPTGFGGTENVGWDAAVSGGKLYLTTGNFNGAQVWRCAICDGSDWEHIVDGDFGPNAFGVVIKEYKNTLIAATTANWSLGESGIATWRSEDGVNWTQISSQGFGDVTNRKLGTGALAIYKGNFYLGTQNISTGAELWQLLNQVYLPLVTK